MLDTTSSGAASNANKNISIHHLTRSIERALDEATYTGELNLNGRKLREFPNSTYINTKCDLSDTISAGNACRAQLSLTHHSCRS